eukprot:gene6994-8125_t
MITGSIDPMFCQTIISVKNNRLTGELPSCYTCHPQEIKIKVAGNNFTNYKDNGPIPKCTTIRANPVRIINGDYDVTVTGQDFGWDKVNFNLSLATRNSRFIEFKHPYNTRLVDSNVTLPLDLNFGSPFIQTVSFNPFSNLGYSFFIQGNGFGSPKTLQVNVGPYPCTVTNNSSIFGEGTVLEDVRVVIGNETCLITNVSSSVVICNIGPGSGVSSITIYVKQLSYFSANSVVYADQSKKCPGDCSGHGKCDPAFGWCYCYAGWRGPDLPFTSTIGRGDNGTTISNGNIKFGFSIHSVRELAVDGELVKEFVIDKWNLTSESDYIWNYSTAYQGASLSYLLEEVQAKRSVSFAGVSFDLEAGALKLSMNVSGWNYQGSLNYLQVVIKSYVDSHSECTLTNIQSGGGGADNVNYITIERDSKILYGRFLDRVLSDGRSTFSSTRILSKDNDSLFIDFSLLINGEEAECGGSTLSKKWLIPTICVVVIFGGISLIIILALLVKKNMIISFKHGFVCMCKESTIDPTELDES